jgi:hypothetical protein
MVTAEYLTSLDDRILFYYIVITVPLSLITKVVSVYIYTRPNLNKKTNTGLLYLIFSILNGIALLVIIFIARSNIILGYQFNFVCGLADFIRTDVYNFSNWIQVLITFDRYILISYPSKVSIMLKKKFLFSIIFAMAAIICLLNVPYFISQRDINFINSTNVTQTIVSCIPPSYVTLINNIIALLMRIYIPFFLMIFFNLLAIKDLRKSRLRLRGYSSSNIASSTHQMTPAKKDQRMSPIEYRFTVSNLAMDFIFLFFYLPLVVYYTLNIVSYFVPVFGNDDVSVAKFNMFSDMAQLFAFTYHIIDIVIFLAFNHTFRDDLFILLRLNFLIKAGNRVEPQNRH